MCAISALQQESFLNAVLLRTARTPRMVLTKLRVHDGRQIYLSDSSSNHRVELLLGTVRCPDVMCTTLPWSCVRSRLLTREPHVSIK